MKKLDTSFATTTVGQPVKGGTLLHLQQAYQEALTAIANNLAGQSYQANVVYVLYGCINTGSGVNYIISSGAVYYNGEVLLVDAITFTAAGGQTATAAIDITYFSDVSADPTTFTDGTPHNVHQIRKIKIASAVSGSTISDFAAFKQTSIALTNSLAATLGASYIAKFDQDLAAFFTAATVDTTVTFDFTNANPGAVVRLKWTWGAGRTLTITGGAGQTILKESGDLSLASSNTNLLTMLYAGINEAGNHEVSYVFSQTA